MLIKSVTNAIALSGLLMAATNGLAAEQVQTNKASPEVITRLQKLYPAMKVSTVKSTPSDGVDEIVFEGGQSIYLLKGTNFLLKGELLRVEEDGLVNVTEESEKSKRKDILDAVNVNDMIVFSPKSEAKGVLTVFTDTDCGYCRKLHQEVPELNAKGIEVRYMAFPRGGVSSSAYSDLSSAWCSEDKQAALNKLKDRQDIPKKECAANPVASQYQIGNAIGVSATPATVLPDGQLVLGYRTAADWVKVLGL